jgi:hypothetical protein
LAVVLWTGAGALAQGQGKGQGGGDKGRGKQQEAKAENAKGNPQAGQEAQKNVGKGKAGKQGDENAVTPGGPKQGGQGKKVGQAAETPEKGKGKGHEQQSQALQKQLQREQAKHMERVARLSRIRELAVKKGDNDTVARVDKLIAKEQDVYSRKLQQVEGQNRATQQLGPQPGAAAKQGVTPPAGPNEVGKGKVVPPEPKPQEKPAGNEVKQEQTAPAGQEKPKNE